MAPEEIPLRLTRSKTSLFIKVLFCDGQWVSRESPFTVSSPSITQSLRTAIENSGNDRLRVKLGTSVHTSNEQDSGIRYHKVCWVNNVTNVLCKPDPGTTPNNGYVRFTSSIFMRVFLKQTMSMRPYAIEKQQILIQLNFSTTVTLGTLE